MSDDSRRTTWLRPKHARTWHRITGHRTVSGRLFPEVACGTDLTGLARGHWATPWETWSSRPDQLRPARWKVCAACALAPEAPQ